MKATETPKQQMGGLPMQAPSFMLLGYKSESGVVLFATSHLLDIKFESHIEYYGGGSKFGSLGAYRPWIDMTARIVSGMMIGGKDWEEAFGILPPPGEDWGDTAGVFT